MTGEKFKISSTEIGDFKDKLGEMFLDLFNENYNTTHEIGKYLCGVFEDCETEQEYEIVDSVVMAICGYSIETIIKRIRERDNDGYCWESCVGD